MFREISFGNAVHGEWCNTITYPTRCDFCGEEVHYFSCDHNSKVFFDSPPGPPWPKHWCAEYELAQFLVEPWPGAGEDVFGEIRNVSEKPEL